MLADYHVHTGFSDDSTYPLRQVALDAVRLNLDELCFTEHVDYGVKPEWNQPDGARFEDGHPVTNCPYVPYLDELDRVREELRGKVTLRAGLELGVQTSTIRENHALVRTLGERLDFVICSIHQVGNCEFWNGDFQRGRTQGEIHRAYYEELLGVVECFRDYTVLGHLDLIRRYDPFGDYPLESVRDLVAAILRQVIDGHTAPGDRRRKGHRGQHLGHTLWPRRLPAVPRDPRALPRPRRHGGDRGVGLP